MKKKINLVYIIIALIIAGAVAIMYYNNFQREDASDNQQVTEIGEVVCLPHKNQDGPHTLECALGLYGNDDKYYALKGVSGIDTGMEIKVTGSLSKDEQSVYDIEGVIDVQRIENL